MSTPGIQFIVLLLVLAYTALCTTRLHKPKHVTHTYLILFSITGLVLSGLLLGETMTMQYSAPVRMVLSDVPSPSKCRGTSNKEVFKCESMFIIIPIEVSRNGTL